MERKHYVYALFRPDNGQLFYIGMGKGLRFSVHVKNRKRGRSHKDNVICKMIDDLGYPDIPVVFVRDGMTRAEACDLEIGLIYAIGRYPYGPLLNVTAGGDGSLGTKGRKSSPEAIAKMKASLTGRTLPAETRAKMSAYRTGRKRAIDTIAKMREKALGRRPSAETRAKMSEKAKARDRTGDWEKRRIKSVTSPEAIEKRKAKMKGKPCPNKGSIWITNGLKNRMIKDLSIPEGWHRGVTR